MESLESRIHYLLSVYLDNRATASEFDELMGLLQVEAGDRVVEEVLQERLEAARPHPEESEVNWGRMVADIVRRPATPVRRLFPWKKIAVAASIVLVLGISSYFLFFNGKDSAPQDRQALKSDIPPPASNRATLTLDGGRIIYLDSVNNGVLAEQNNVNVTKQADGRIVYGHGAPAGSNDQVVYNTLYNPRGSKVMHLMLGDGTRVWLNAESSLRYPAVFAGDERKVEITGEAFFEVNSIVAAGKKMPFIVKKGDMEVTVTGTRFNVNAYEDEKDITVTLLEGRVGVGLSNAAQGLPARYAKLIPGQQARVSLSGRDVAVLDNADLEKSAAWKENVFLFSRDGIQTIMRQLSRWYNVQVVYKGEGGDQHFTGIISRNNNISEVLKMLEAAGKVRFEIEKEKVTVVL